MASIESSLGWLGDLIAQHLYRDSVPQPMRRRWSFDGAGWTITDDPVNEVAHFEFSGDFSEAPVTFGEATIDVLTLPEISPEPSAPANGAKVYSTAGPSTESNIHFVTPAGTIRMRSDAIEMAGWYPDLDVADTRLAWTGDILTLTSNSLPIALGDDGTGKAHIGLDNVTLTDDSGKLIVSGATEISTTCPTLDFDASVLAVTGVAIEIRGTNYILVRDPVGGNRVVIDDTHTTLFAPDGSAKIKIEDVGLGVFGHATAGQTASVAALTDNTGATANDAIENVPAATGDAGGIATVSAAANVATVASVNASFAATENNIADLTAKVNLLIAHAKAHGWMAT